MNKLHEQQQRTGRNAPCFCGSNKKYKLCCLQPKTKTLPTEQVKIARLLQLANADHQAGRLAQAKAIYLEILSIYPEQPDALHLSGVIAYQQGELDSAEQWIQKAINANSGVADYYNNLAIVLRTQGKPVAAVANYRLALQLKPDYAEAHNNLGVIFRSQGKPDEAIDCFKKALAIQPNYVDAHINLGMMLRDQGKLSSAIDHLQKAIGLKPNSAEAHCTLGGVFRLQGKPENAIECFRKALTISPNYVDAHINIGMTFRDIDQMKPAAGHLQRAAQIKPDSVEAFTNLGLVLMEQGQLDKSVQCYLKAISIRPNYSQAYNGLGSTLMEQCRHQEAKVIFEKGLTFDPGYFPLHNGLIFATSRMCVDNAELFRVSRNFGKQFEADSSRVSHTNNASPDRRLRVGYVSGDFRQHSVAYLIKPILAKHDKRNVEVFCYYNHHRIDEVTQELMGYTDHWRSIFDVSDADAVELIRQDQIDILMDLSGHTAFNRLLVFAQKPAPIQVTWIGYPATTGLATMDYRLTNLYIDPLGWNEDYHTESLFRLPSSACFQPEQMLPDIGPLPALKNGHLTFASFHTNNKITPVTLSLWAKLLSALPTAKLVLAPDNAKNQIIRQFQQLGIAEDRLVFFPKQSMPQYLALHNNVDIMLDTLPYNGGTVSRHSLYMGVPVLTLPGRHAVSRVGLSLMSQLGLETFVADNEESFVDIGCRCSNDLEGLAEIRATLRQRMQTAPFNNAAFVAGELEAAYRHMWQTWCDQQDHDR